MSNAISIGQWNSSRRRTYEGAHETFSNSSGSFNHVSSTNEQLDGRTKLDSGVNFEGVCCSRYMTDWDRYLPQEMGAYSSTQHSSTTGISPHMMLTGHEKSLPLIFF